MKKKLTIAIILGISIFLSILYGTKLNQAYSPLPPVYYDGQKRTFTYLNVNHKDLHPSFIEIMPGDIKEQKINIVEEKDSYEFKFNIVSYNGEKINESDFPF